MVYEQLITYFQLHWKRKEAGFIQKHYIEWKGEKEIIEEMYMNSRRTYYHFKKRMSDFIKTFVKNGNSWKNAIEKKE